MAFHGEWSPYSNFHHSPFELGGNLFNTAEQYIQYHKALFFGDKHTANLILQAESPYEVKKLSYQIKDVDLHRWQNEGFEICFEEIKAKFVQNESLLKMLKTTAPLTLVETSKDRIWGIGFSLHDRNAFNPDSWLNKGWMSRILGMIRDEELEQKSS